MDIEGEFRNVTLSIDFENETWADAEKAKIHAMTVRALKAMEPPLDPMAAFLRAFQNDPGALSRQGAMDRNAYARQQMAGLQCDPYGGGNMLAALGLGGVFGFSHCACCGR